MNEHNDKPKQPTRKAPSRISRWQLVWHCLLGITLGAICAGLLLQIGASHPGSLIAGADTLVARFRFILTVALVFGAGATMTGAMFLINEKS